MLKILLFASLYIFSTFAINGIDINTGEGPFSLDTWKCVKNSGYDFAIIQIWRGGYQLGKHFTTEWTNAKAAGIKYVDAYIFACNNCIGNAPENVCSKVASALPNGFDGMVWLDIEICTACFVGSPEDKLHYFESIVNVCTSKGMKMGIYSFYGGWWDMFGSPRYTSGTLTKLPLWYAHYNNDKTFSDFEQYKFGDWKKPAIKQWKADATVCGILCDLSAY